MTTKTCHHFVVSFVSRPVNPTKHSEKKSVEIKQDKMYRYLWPCRKKLKDTDYDKYWYMNVRKKKVLTEKKLSGTHVKPADRNTVLRRKKSGRNKWSCETSPLCTYAATSVDIVCTMTEDLPEY